MKYRLYIDEVGNSDMGSSDDPNHRYLSLTGVILELRYVVDVVYPKIEDLKKRYFGSHPDEPIVLHRKDILNKRAPFEALRNPVVEQKFNAEMISLLESLDYSVITAIIDKQQLKARYAVWRHDPYHYSLEVLIERYVLWLQECNTTGDVMAESRGGKEDMRLKKSFKRLCDEGTDYLKPDTFRSVLTSTELKVKPKVANVTGLQLADIIAHPSRNWAMARRDGLEQPTTFGGRVAAILERCKYIRNREGKIEGWGVKWLP